MTLAVAPWACDENLLHGQGFGIEASRRYCRGMARGHYENFPVALSLFDKGQQRALAAIYAFARTADDFADESGFSGLRERMLADWERQLRACFEGEATHPVFIALREAVAAHDLPIEPFLDLLDAFVQDCSKTSYATFDEVLDYCRRSANPVGRLVLKVLGAKKPELVPWSDRICTALQLTNFWQDISVDAKKSRIYLPDEDLERFKVPAAAILNRRGALGFGPLVRFEAARTKALFLEGRPLLARAGFPGTLYFSAVWLGGRAVLRMVREAGEQVLHRRPVLCARSFVRVAAGAGRDRLAVLA
ncbi:MAG: squalene synthase HpnC [Deltaproteobacteria bacterium]|nr:squalene synthase HpnC [Deltaproteobacteria bacterium]